MKEKYKVKICNIVNGKISKSIPEEFESSFFRTEIESYGWKQGDSAWSTPHDFFLWIKETSEEDGFETLSMAEILGTMNLTELILENHQLLADIKQEDNWLEAAVNISVTAYKEK
ncbi:hypothetical protein [Lactococcus petauri]|uniref:Uncharacterized protein n=1 Tax=Lactococcus petauri TaxID=1940789 RepID=A0A252CB98_9LACT|nr:hypothetical protein [Lactococcus petauri]OUK03857.1 hypothetical protein BZZ03_09400 [Lactococcus petauri]